MDRMDQDQPAQMTISQSISTIPESAGAAVVAAQEQPSVGSPAKAAARAYLYYESRLSRYLGDSDQSHSKMLCIVSALLG